MPGIFTLTQTDAHRLEPRIEARLFLQAVGISEQVRRPVRRVGERRGVVCHGFGADLSGGVGEATGLVVVVGQHAARGVGLLPRANLATFTLHCRVAPPRVRR